ncbi:hypothetical protein [Streptomyces axinellae]|uniref:WCX domain-containing protein n=1 Tax=Streptomyces axinellae TaxID=552788 RepID=A0ABP6CF60_9ACTN
MAHAQHTHRPRRPAPQLLQCGTSVEVLDPPQARQEMARRAAGITALYETGELPEVLPLRDGWE